MVKITDTRKGFLVLLWPHCVNLLSFESAVPSYALFCRCLKHAAHHFILCVLRLDLALITECSQAQNWTIYFVLLKRKKFWAQVLNYLLLKYSRKGCWNLQYECSGWTIRRGYLSSETWPICFKIPKYLAFRHSAVSYVGKAFLICCNFKYGFLVPRLWNGRQYRNCCQVLRT